ncbi:MAG: RNA polymerase sigma factor [Marinilabiliales bacterium]|nr:RNA polymerase sigma factor [Marinilabiliales bacterium]
MLQRPEQKDKAFLQLMEQYQKPIYWHIRRLVVTHEDAEDVLQETFIQVYRKADTFRGESAFFTWLYKIATNECIRWLRKKKNRENRNEKLKEDQVSDTVISDNESEMVILEKFQNAILKLPEKQRLVFNLRYYDELSYEEIAKILDTRVNALKTNYHYACEKIKRHLTEQA